MQSRLVGRFTAWVLLLSACLGAAPLAARAHETGARHVHFRKPDRTPPQNEGLQFRNSTPTPAARPSATDRAQSAAHSVSSQRQAAKSQPVVAEQATSVANKPAHVVRAAESRRSNQPSFASPGRSAKAAEQQRYGQVVQASYEPAMFESRLIDNTVAAAGYCDHCAGGCDASCGCPEPSCAYYEPSCQLVDPGCGLVEAGCSIIEPTCGCNEPACGICEPTCAVYEPGCAIYEPGCAIVGDPCNCGDPTCGVPGCGSCVASPGPDYWCFPVCLPRFKDMRIWAGVHGFKGPRDILDGGPGDGNFGFNQGITIGGRAPLVGLAFPQLSYQLGYQAMQNRLSGTSDGSPGDRPQQFVTAGVFRRAPTGLQMGVVWDMMRDELIVSQDFSQVRYQISLASPEGREFGFRGSSGSDSEMILGRIYKPVDQYTLFFGWHFRRGGHGRFWGGGSDDSEGIFGAEFDVPINDRWTVYSTFNYLIPEAEAGLTAATEESWNVGVNLVWHFGRMARKGRYNPHRAMFEVADNGSVFIDEQP